jgi:hypothetical protein
MDSPVYQLKIVLNGIKPPVWRRVLVTGNTTISLLHEIIQVAMGWDNCHLHQFVIRGKEYGVSYEGGIHFADNPDEIRLDEFRFRPVERFEYQYDFGDNWEHTVTVEKLLPGDAAQMYPVCVAGRGECPPEDSGGPWIYSARRQGKSRGKVDAVERSADKTPFDAEPVNMLLQNLHTRWFTRATALG